MLPKFVLLLFVLPYFVQGESLFGLENRWPIGPLTQPSEASLNLKKGSGTSLSCKSTEKFNLCRWARPNVADSCSIFGHASSDAEQSCSTDGWSITKLSDGKTCKINIESSKESDSGKWVCYLESYPSKSMPYTSVEAATMITVIEPPIVELKGPSQIPVTLDTKNQFMCVARGSPKPARLEWTISNNPMTVLDSELASGSSLDGDFLQMIVSATVLPEWIGKELKCTAVTLDDAGNELRASDTRTLRIIESRGAVSGVSWGDSGEFRIVERQPPGRQGEIPSILVAPDSEITFSCTSSVPWDVCRFQRPNSDQPCGLLSYDTAQRTQCRMVWSDYSVSPGEWFLRKESPTKCSITGMAANVMDEGEWNCHLQSKPILGPHSTYDSDQGDFSMRVIRPPRLMADNFPLEIEGVDGDTVELSISVSDANPAPRVDWFINFERAMITILEQSDLVYNSLGSVSFTQKIHYIVHAEDSGKKLICKVVQFDTFGKEVVVSLESLLTIKARPPPLQSQGLNVTIIGVIVACAAFILLALILLVVAFRTGKLCFKKPQHTVEDVDAVEMGAQTEGGLRHEIGIGADFGPNKPRRVEQATREETAPLIVRDKKTQSMMPDTTKADNCLSGNDELLIYTIEGQCSPATSLSSINTYVPDKDWTESLRKLGLRDLVSGSSQESLTQSESGTEI